MEGNGTRRFLFMIIGFLTSILMILGGIVFSFDRNRLSNVETQQAQHERLDGHAVSMERLNTIQYQLARIEDKLDKLSEKVKRQ